MLLNKVDPIIFKLPYWDSVMDSYIPNPADSIIWSDQFTGNSQGPLTSGPFAGWRVTRRVGAEGSPFNESNLVDFMTFSDINSVLSATAPRQGCPSMPTFSAMEYSHGICAC